ncbi:hypothetical protein [Rhodococcus aetherivorans]
MNTDYPQEAELPSGFGDLVEPPDDVWSRAVHAAVDAEPTTDLADLVPFVDTAEDPDLPSDLLLDDQWLDDGPPNPDGHEFDEDSSDVEDAPEISDSENDGVENDNVDMPTDESDDGLA